MLKQVSGIRHQARGAEIALAKHLLAQALADKVDGVRVFVVVRGLVQLVALLKAHLRASTPTPLECRGPCV